MKITDTIGVLLGMSRERSVLSIDPDHSVYEALEMLAKYDIGVLLVCTKQSAGGHLLRARLRTQRHPWRAHLPRNPREATDDQPGHLRQPKHTVDECMTLMTQHDFRHLPVVQNDKVVGVVSIGDLVKWVISGQQQTIQALEGYIAGAYPS